MTTWYWYGGDAADMAVSSALVGGTNFVVPAPNSVWKFYDSQTGGTLYTGSSLRDASANPISTVTALSTGYYPRFQATVGSMWADASNGSPRVLIQADSAAAADVTAIQATLAALPATYVTVVNHGSTAGTARPSGATSVRWVGTVVPTNAVNGDLYENTSTGDMQVMVSGAFITMNSTANDARYAQRPGVRPFFEDKIFGGNIVPAPGTWGWRDLHSTWDWTNWIKPQVDRAAILGMNAIRLIGAPEVVFPPDLGGSSAPAITQAKYVAQWEQLATYCEQKGLALYPCLVSWADYTDQGFSDVSNTTMLAAITASAAALAQHPNVIGFDIFNEGAGAGSTNTLSIMASVRAAAPGIPLTNSHPTGSGAGGFTSGWNDTSTAPYTVLTSVAGSDFADYHYYADGMFPDLIDLVCQRATKPILIGEMGGNQSQTSSVRVARYLSMAAVHNRPNVLGTFIWGLADQKNFTDTTPNGQGQLGVWDNTGWVAGTSPLSTSSGQRSDMVNTFEFFNRAPVPTTYLQPNLLDPSCIRPVISVSNFATGANTAVVSSSKGAKWSNTSGSAANISGGTSTGLGFVPITQGAFYKVEATFLGDAARTCHLSINWYDSSKTFISGSTGVSGTDSANNPLMLKEVAQASPAAAAYAAVHVQIDSVAASGAEFHFVSEIAVRPY